MSRALMGRFAPPDPDEIKQLKRELWQRDAQIRSLTAEVRRLQSLLPRSALKSHPRPTRAEKIARNRPPACL